VPLPLLLLLLLLCAGACSNKGAAVVAAPQSSDAKPSKIVCLGRLVPGERVIQVAAPVGAILKDLRVRRGDDVKQGQIVAALRDEDVARASVEQMRTEVTVAEAQLAQVEAGEKPGTIQAQQAVVARLEAESEKATADSQRVQELHRQQIVSQADREQAQASRASASERVREAKEQLAGLKWVRPQDVTTARSKLAAVKAALGRAEADLERNLIRAPIDGRILDINAYPGESVGARGIADLADTRTMMVEAEVYVTDIARVSIGAVARIKAEGFGELLAGRVIEILGQVNPNVALSPDPYSFVDRRVVKARIRLDDGARVASLINTQVTVEIQP
jgi:HlyD family secretion protein